MPEITGAVHRTICGEGSGCFGSVTIPSWDHPGAYTPIDSLAHLLNEELCDGDVVRITIEVIEKGPGIVRTNPWHHMNRRNWPNVSHHDLDGHSYDCPCIHTVKAGDKVRP